MSLLLDCSLLGCVFSLPLFVCLFAVSSSEVTNVLFLQCSLCELFEEKQLLVQNEDKKFPKASDQEGKSSLQACKPKQSQAINMWWKEMISFNLFTVEILSSIGYSPFVFHSLDLADLCSQAAVICFFHCLFSSFWCPLA